MTSRVLYIGPDWGGGFRFFDLETDEGFHFWDLDLAAKQFGSRILISRSGLSAPFHSGHNDALAGHPCCPRTDVSDGAPRNLNDDEARDYYFGYLKGLIVLHA